ncbi:MAG TPA: hypothetical protein VGB02_03405 [Pyrinomonadaceae bacterium]|jgi:hypothetical protein
MKLKIIIIAIIALVSSNAFAQKQKPSATSSTDLSQPKVDSGVDAKEISIRDLAIQLGSPGGIIFLPDIDVEKKYRFEPPSLSVSDMLNSIAKVEPEYRWETQDGVVNLFPANKYPVFLDTIIPEFDAKDTNIHLSIDTLQQLPVFQQQATSFGYSNYTVRRVEFLSVLSSGKLKNFNVHCRNSTLRGVLNSIVRGHGRAVWGFREYMQNGNKFFQLWIIFS